MNENTDLELKYCEESKIVKEKEMVFKYYYVVINGFKVKLNPVDFTAREILEDYYSKADNNK